MIYWSVGPPINKMDCVSIIRLKNGKKPNSNILVISTVIFFPFYSKTFQIFTVCSMKDIPKFYLSSN